MSQQIRFFRKNIIDLQNTDGSITVTDAVATDNGQDIVDYVRNRNNFSAWLTTGSTDAANTTLEVLFGVGRDITDIILVKHNWKAFTIQYWNGSSYVDFSTAINESANADETTHFNFDSVDTDRIKIIITGCQVVDADKELYQLVITQGVGSGQLAGWPVIKSPTHDSNKRKSKMLSGKINVVESTGAFGCELEVSNWKIENDINILEWLYFSREGVILWLCGGDEGQFTIQARGYRKEDLFYVRATNNYEPEFVRGIYTAGFKIKLALQEAIE